MKRDEIKVSILVPIYGVEAYVERCVVSLMEQTYANLEYIFVNDCTPDNSILILEDTVKKYPNRQSSVRIIEHHGNKGLAGARITALEHATGDYIMHVDSDDWLDVSAIEKMVIHARESQADIIDGAYSNVYSSHTTMISPWNGNDETYLKLILGGTGLVSNQIWGRLIKKSLYVVNGINAIEGVDYGEDYSVLARLLYFGKRDYINEVVYYYNHLNENSYMNNLNQKSFNSLVRSKELVFDFYANKTDFQQYKFSLLFGLINALRHGLKSGLRDDNLNELINKHINHQFLLKLYLRLILCSNLIISKIMFQVIVKLKYKGR